jgi:hypothetical protein
MTAGIGLVRCRFAALLIALLSIPLAASQGQVMQQGGVIPQHFTMWAGNNAVQDAAGVARAPQGLQPFELGIVAPPNSNGSFPATATGQGPNGENECIYDAPSGVGGHYLCFSPNIGSNTGAISFGSVGGGAVGGLDFIINGTKIACCTGSGNVSGPGVSVVGDVATFNATNGTLLADSGILASNILTTSAAAAIYAPLASPTFTGTPISTTPSTADNSTKIATTAFVKNQGYLTSVTIPVPAPQGRLTLTSHTPVLTASVTGTSTIYYDAYNGNSVAVYNGTTDTVLQIPSNEITLVLTTLEEATANVFDIFAFNNSGTLALCTPTNAGGSSGKGWAGDTSGSNTARGTGYSQLDNHTRPYITNANSITNCFGGASGTTNFGTIAANQATYLGTYYTTAAGQTGINMPVSGVSGGNNPYLYVWNYYNRVTTTIKNLDQGASYTYTLAAIRQARGSANNQCNYVYGVAEDSISVERGFFVSLVAVVGAAFNVGIGFDNTTSFYPTNNGTGNITANPGNAAATSSVAGAASVVISPAVSNILGFHSITFLEGGDSANANTFNAAGVDTAYCTIRG